MCCFSVATPVGWLARLLSPRVRVSSTNLFARMLAPGEQALVYSMSVSLPTTAAMILPLPVAFERGDDAVAFVDLTSHSTLFSDLAELFTPPPSRSKGGSPFQRARQQTLAVHKVGAFVASWVPRITDFERLDPRFRLPPALVDAVPHYRDYGFAVFQLDAGKQTQVIQPMAMRFPTRSPDRLFFPTVHVHDGRFTAEAHFDHALYYQTPRAESMRSPHNLVDDEIGWANPTRDYAGLVAPALPVVRRTLRGRLPNRDLFIDV